MVTARRMRSPQGGCAGRSIGLGPPGEDTSRTLAPFDPRPICHSGRSPLPPTSRTPEQLRPAVQLIEGSTASREARPARSRTNETEKESQDNAWRPRGYLTAESHRGKPARIPGVIRFSLVHSKLAKHHSVSAAWTIELILAHTSSFPELGQGCSPPQARNGSRPGRAMCPTCGARPSCGVYNITCLSGNSQSCLPEGHMEACSRGAQAVDRCHACKSPIRRGGRWHLALLAVFAGWRSRKRGPPLCLGSRPRS